jgi:hypothetical protein
MSAEIQYRRFTDDDNDLWAKHDKTTGQVQVLQEIRYYMGGAMRNEMERQAVIGTILEENGITLNTKTLSLPSDFYNYEEWIKNHPGDGILSFSKEDIVSKDGAIYKYFLMPDDGRGWGVVVKGTVEGTEVIAEDHIDNITDELMALAKDLGIDLETKHTYDEDIELDDFKPAPKDF